MPYLFILLYIFQVQEYESKFMLAFIELILNEYLLILTQLNRLDFCKILIFLKYNSYNLVKINKLI